MPWTALDLGNVVVHLMTPEQRGHYDLEEVYGKLSPLELPFDGVVWEDPSQAEHA